MIREAILVLYGRLVSCVVYKNLVQSSEDVHLAPQEILIKEKNNVILLMIWILHFMKTIFTKQTSHTPP